MSTVLWANHLFEGRVTSDESDKVALHRHLKKLDRLCELWGVVPISTFCDSTDARCNLDLIDLPEGMESTDELMAVEGVWIEADGAERALAALLDGIRENRTRFGLLRNDHDLVVAELSESLAFARSALDRGANFNFSIVM